MSNLVAAPFCIPLLAAALGLVCWRRPLLQQAITLIGTAAQLVAAVALLVRVREGGGIILQVGGWTAPFGIALVADPLAAIMVLVGSVVGLACTCFSVRVIDEQRRRYGYFPLVSALLAGANLAFLTGDIFNLFVAFEVMLIASFVLLALGGGRKQTEGALHYVTLNLLASALFLAGVGLVYGMSGTLNLAELGARLEREPRQGLVLASGGLFFLAFGIKAAVFPLMFWLPAAYPTPPAVLAALFSGLLTKVGVYALLRFFTGVYGAWASTMQPLLLWVAGLTMVVGVLGAAVQTDIRRILSFHIVSQIGYSVMGLALFAPLGLAGAIFFVVHNILAKCNLFLVGHAVYILRGSYALSRLGGIYSERPLFSALFLLPALSLAGLPPLSGFVAKLLLVKAGLEQDQYAVVAAALGTGLLTLFSMTKIWSQAFFRPAPEGGAPRGRLRGWQLAPITGLALLTVWLGIQPRPLFQISEEAARVLLNGRVLVGAGR